MTDTMRTVRFPGVVARRAEEGSRWRQDRAERLARVERSDKAIRREERHTDTRELRRPVDVTERLAEVEG
ncbi:MAG: hypothetical protein J0I33_13860 [Microbacterium ginsengisoli]|uniref:hypothetical protein n=1 Tax=Microbacterium TaxID=33882 RepID=UPI0006FB169D|nr:MULTISPECIES: hypothetical protein [unclassified Microbacterium]KQR90988.1 hypothetical protein ASF93_08715 [Microbacterium sp. Leaf347]KQS00014.1 hypothetical protein ASG00_11005 [Microbacterium sp. Leaf351]MBN9199716.1 hypothetical protein [Microbacterium ginsengisoli]OJU75243.1 MAG: hypothetical protein BGO15_04240 [Microbacterium sp. 71-23]